MGVSLACVSTRCSAQVLRELGLNMYKDYNEMRPGTYSELRCWVAGIDAFPYLQFRDCTEYFGMSSSQGSVVVAEDANMF